MKITFTHRIKRSYRLSIFLDPPPPSPKPFDCHCQFFPYRIICPACISRMGLPAHCSVPVSWGRIGRRASNQCRVDLIGGTAPQQNIDLLTALNIPRSAIHYSGIKSIEQFVAIERWDVLKVIKAIRRFYKVPGTNQILEGSWISQHERDPDDDAVWSQGSKQILFQGEFVETTLPRTIYNLNYFITVYQIAGTPAYPAKMELLAIAPNGVWVPENLMPVIRKSMAQFLLGMCQIAGIDPVHIRLDMLGGPYQVTARGQSVEDEQIRCALALADSVDLNMKGFPELRRETLVSSLCVCAGRPLSPNRIARLLNGKQGKLDLLRTERPFRYQLVSLTPMMKRLRKFISRQLREFSGEVIPKPFNYRFAWVQMNSSRDDSYSWLSPDHPLAGMRLEITRAVRSGDGVISEDDENDDCIGEDQDETVTSV